MQHILAYDIGTSGVKASLYDRSGRLEGSRYVTYPTFYSGDGLREQKPQQWWESIVNATRTIIQQCDPEGIEGIGVSGHSLGVIPVDANGQLLAEATPIWSDTRAVLQAGAFFERVDYRQWYEATGNGFPRHLYALFKQMWLRDNAPETYNNTFCFLGSKDYINLLLTGVMATDRSYASGSGAYSLLEGQYIPAYLEAADVSAEKLPRIAESSEVIGYVTDKAAAQLGISSGVPVVAGGVDNACMTLGANCRCNGDAYASLGSSAWVTVSSNVPAVNFKAKTYTFAHCVPGQYLPSAGIFSSGSSLEWTINNLLTRFKGDPNVYTELAALVEAAPVGANGLVFIPNLAGGSAFDPSPDVRGLIAGLDLKHTEGDLARAIYEGIAMHLKCAYDVLAEDVDMSESLLVVGGGAKSDIWRSIYADIFCRKIVKTSVMQDAASLGAAALAAVGSGLWTDFAPLDSAQGKKQTTEPDAENAAFYAHLLSKYKKLCELTQCIADIIQ